MKKIREKILELLEKGKITKQEAGEMLEAIEEVYKKAKQATPVIDMERLFKTLDDIGKRFYTSIQDLVEQSGIEDFSRKVRDNVKRTTNEIMHSVDEKIKDVTSTLITKDIAGRKTTIVLSYYRGGMDLHDQDLIILGKMEGDIKLENGKLRIVGKIDGDMNLENSRLEIMGRSFGDIECSTELGIKLTGKSDGDIVVNSGSVRIFGKNAGDITLQKGHLRITGVVSGNLFVGQGDIDLLGRIEGDVKIEAGNLTLYRSSRINGNIELLKGDLMLKRGAEINGSVNIVSGNRVEDAGEDEAPDQDAEE